MRKLVLAALAALSLASCTTDQVAQAEAKAAAVLASIKQGATVAVSTVKDALDGICAQGAIVNAGAQAATGLLNQQTGPNTTANVNAVNRSLSTLAATCNAAAANPTDPKLASLLKSGWAAYLAAKASQNNAVSSASKGI